MRILYIYVFRHRDNFGVYIMYNFQLNNKRIIVRRYTMSIHREKIENGSRRPKKNIKRNFSNFSLSSRSSITCIIIRRHFIFEQSTIYIYIYTALAPLLYISPVSSASGITYEAILLRSTAPRIYLYIFFGVQKFSFYKLNLIYL